MSCSKLQKFIDKPIPHVVIRKKPIVLTSSKGFYLKRHLDLLQNLCCNIEFNCQPGGRFTHFLRWLETELPVKVISYPHIVLYVWLGTCDLTVKQGKFISLRHQTSEFANSDLHSIINKFVSIVSNFPTVQLVFLEIPSYSIQEWNKSKGHPNPDSFQHQDDILNDRVLELNSFLTQVNNRLCVSSPHLRLDLVRYRKAKHQDKSRVSLNFSLYKDGIHPTPLLARCWMKRLVVSICTYCV